MSDYPKKKTPVPVQISAPSAGVEPWPPLRPSPPREVRNAFKLWIANLAFGFTMGFVIGFITALTARQRAAVSAQPVNVGAVIVGLLGALIVLGLEIFFLLKMRKGKNWARVIMTVLAGLNIIEAALSFLQGHEFALITGMTAITLLAPATVLLYRPVSNAYFRAHRYV